MEEYAKFAIVAWIDGLMIKNVFTGDHWRDLVLEVQYFRKGGAAETEFFKRCEHAKRRGYKTLSKSSFSALFLVSVAYMKTHRHLSIAGAYPEQACNGRKKSLDW